MEHPVFSDQDLAVLRSLGSPRRYPAGERLFVEGELSDYVVLIERGTVKISSVSPEGYESVLARRGPGRTIGEFAALDGLPRLGSAVGASRDAAARTLRKLQRFGAITRERGRVSILQPELLRKIGGLPERRGTGRADPTDA